MATSDFMGNFKHPADADYSGNATHPFLDADGDKLREECGVFGAINADDASTIAALGLHALQHRGQEAGGIVTYEPNEGFSASRRFGLVRHNFTKQDVIDSLPGTHLVIEP